MLAGQFKIKFTLVFLVALLASCETINRWTASALDTLDTGVKKTQTKKIRKQTLRRKKATVRGEPTPTPTSKTEDIVIKRDVDDDKKIKKTRVKTAVAPEFKVDAPVHVTKRVGGVARFIAADDKYIYADYPQHLAVYDNTLELIALTQVKFPIVAIKRFDIGGTAHLYLKERNPNIPKNNYVLEVYKLTLSEAAGQTVPVLKEVKSIEMGENFYWITPDIMLTFLDQKIEFRDIADDKQIRIVNEQDLAAVTDAIVIGDHLYLSRNRFLDVIKLDTYRLVSSIRIGKDFSFLGFLPNQNPPRLMLGYVTPGRHLTGIQILQLDKNLSGISNFGENIMLPLTLTDHSFGAPFVIGREIENTKTGPVQLFSIKHKRFLRGPLGTKTDLIAWSFGNGKLYLVNDREITVNKIILNQDVIAQAAAIQKIMDTNTPVPLAQIGAEKIVRDEYSLTAVEKLEFMSDSRKVALLDPDHFILFENTADKRAHRIFATKTFSQEDFVLHEPQVPALTRHDRLLVTPIGLLTYSEQTGEIYFLDIELKELKLLPIKPGRLLSWVHFSSEQREILALTRTVPKTKKTNKSAPYQVVFYHLKSPSEANELATIDMSQPPFVFYIPQNQIIVLTSNQMDLYAFDEILSPPKPKEHTGVQSVKGLAEKAKEKKKRLKRPEPQETVQFTEPLPDILAAKMSPAYDTLYILFRSDDQLKIRVLDIFDITNTSVLADFDITKEQFEGASFSKKGRLFILPSWDGTLFYDMTDVTNPKEVAHWPEVSYYVDLVDQGRYICVALGYKGVYCGRLLF